MAVQCSSLCQNPDKLQYVLVTIKYGKSMSKKSEVLRHIKIALKAGAGHIWYYCQRSVFSLGAFQHRIN